MNNDTVEQVLNKIEEASDYVFLYNDKTIQKNRIVSVRNKSGKILDILDDIFKGTDITYTVVDKQIILSTNKMQLVQQEGQIQIKGVVKDAGGDPLDRCECESERFYGRYYHRYKRKLYATDQERRYSGNFLCGICHENSKGTECPSSEYCADRRYRSTEKVVVTALGIKKEAKSLSYNVQQVSNAEITRIADANFVNNLNGKVAGVTIKLIFSWCRWLFTCSDAWNQIIEW